MLVTAVVPLVSVQVTNDFHQTDVSVATDTCTDDEQQHGVLSNDSDGLSGLHSADDCPDVSPLQDVAVKVVAK